MAEIKTMNKRVIYSANIGYYDHPWPTITFDGWDFLMFTDKKDFEIKGWQMVYVDLVGSPVDMQREIKINSHKYVGNYDLSIWADANQVLTGHPNHFLDHIHYTSGFATTKHHARSTMTDEVNQILLWGKDTEERCRLTVETLFKKTKMPNDWGLFETGVTVRDNSKEVEKLNKLWYQYWQIGSHRDQLSLPFAAYKSKVPIHTFERSQRTPFFRQYLHRI